MEPRDHQDNDQRQDGGSPPREEDRAGNSRPAAGPQAIGTNDPAITAGPAYPADPERDPDQTTVIETNRIRGPNEAFTPNFVVVPIEREVPNTPKNHARQGGEDEKAPSDSRH